LPRDNSFRGQVADLLAAEQRADVVLRIVPIVEASLGGQSFVRVQPIQVEVQQLVDRDHRR